MQCVCLRCWQVAVRYHSRVFAHWQENNQVVRVLGLRDRKNTVRYMRGIGRCNRPMAHAQPTCQTVYSNTSSSTAYDEACDAISACNSSPTCSSTTTAAPQRIPTSAFVPVSQSLGNLPNLSRNENALSKGEHLPPTSEEPQQKINYEQLGEDSPSEHSPHSISASHNSTSHNSSFATVSEATQLTSVVEQHSAFLQLSEFGDSTTEDECSVEENPLRVITRNENGHIYMNFTKLKQ